MAKLANSQRVKVVGDVADQVLQHLKPDPIQFVDTVFNMELRPFQWKWWYLMDEHPDVLGYSCMRVGKTVVVQLRNLYEMLTNPFEEQMIFTPRYDQAVKTFKVAYDIVERSELLQAFVKRNAIGKKEFGKGHVEFQNNSAARCFGVTSQFEGENATIQHVDELDDIPADTLKRVLGRATGKNRNGLPTRHRFTGVIWGKLNIYHYQTNSDFYLLPPVNVYQGIAAGWLTKKDVLEQRAQMSDDEWLRTQCLKFVEARNYIWSSWLRMSQTIGLHWDLTPVPPSNKTRFRKEGVVAFGLDMGAQGAGADASDYSLQVVEMVGNYRRWIWGRTWAPDTSPDQLINEISDYWQFFQPDLGYSDARDANLAAQINSELYKRRVTYYNWMSLGKNDQEGWREWAKMGLMTPVHNSGRTKHYMYHSLKNAIFNCMNINNLNADSNIFVFPQVDRNAAENNEHWRELLLLERELRNLISERMASGFDKITRNMTKISDAKLSFSGSLKLGDDRPDALAMANFALDFLRPRHAVVGNIGLAYLPGI